MEQVSTVGASWPNPFSLSGLSRMVGVTTSKFESMIGEKPAIPPAAPTSGTQVVPSPGLFSETLNLVESPVKLAEAKASAAYQSVKDAASSAVSSVESGVSGVVGGSISLVHYLVFGLIAAAVIYAIATWRAI